MTHVEITGPNWDTKTLCSCGERFATRYTFYLHAHEENLVRITELEDEVEKAYQRGLGDGYEDCYDKGLG